MCRGLFGHIIGVLVNIRLFCNMCGSRKHTSLFEFVFVATSLFGQVMRVSAHTFYGHLIHMSSLLEYVRVDFRNRTTFFEYVFVATSLSVHVVEVSVDTCLTIFWHVIFFWHVIPAVNVTRALTHAACRCWASFRMLGSLFVHIRLFGHII